MSHTSVAFGRTTAAPYPFRLPWLTAVLLLTFIAVFMLEQRLSQVAGTRPPALGTLIALGGLSRSLVESGQWFRLLTAPFLHGSVTHLVSNGVAFALAGYALERLVGPAWMFCIFAAGALAGSAASLAMAAPGMVSVGASGAIMAMLTALFMSSFRLPSGATKRRIQYASARTVIPALIPLHHGAVHIDLGAHIGGAVFGAVLGFLLLRTWHASTEQPDFQRTAMVFAAMAALSFATSAIAVAQRYPSAATPSPSAVRFPTMIPASQYPHGAEAMAEQADNLLASYPRDPRSHLIAASARARRGNIAAAEQELRTGLWLAEAAPPPVGPSVTNTIRASLAVTVLAAGRPLEARAIAHDACVAGGDGALPAEVATMLARSGLCGAGGAGH